MSRRCDNCQARWPTQAKCPVCGLTTRYDNRAATRTQQQARAADFDRRYVAREAERIAAGHVAPEALGRREAHEIMEWDRRMAA